ncbi:MAG: hypothetical protein K0S32_4311 [Bacteroidetes bacterium]|jgi:hypothetical protein|nr:hypothetical protein [Bacteroidota bacterium]
MGFLMNHMAFLMRIPMILLFNENDMLTIEMEYFNYPCQSVKSVSND